VLTNVEKPMIKYKSYNSSTGIIIAISNNGPEIPQEIKDKIFEAGFSTKNNSSGDRGFGLSIVKDIMNRCTGCISITSNKNFTQFTFEIPLNSSCKQHITVEEQH
jgi:signal transduction histidine kinase